MSAHPKMFRGTPPRTSRGLLRARFVHCVTKDGSARVVKVRSVRANGTVRYTIRADLLCSWSGNFRRSQTKQTPIFSTGANIWEARGYCPIWDNNYHKTLRPYKTLQYIANGTNRITA